MNMKNLVGVIFIREHQFDVAVAPEFENIFVANCL